MDLLQFYCNNNCGMGSHKKKQAQYHMLSCHYLILDICLVKGPDGGLI